MGQSSPFLRPYDKDYRKGHASSRECSCSKCFNQRTHFDCRIFGTDWVIVCTFSGGLKATFFADYLNSVLPFVVILILVTIIYFNNSEIGGISGLFEKLVSLVSANPVQGKAGGAYLTMAFTGALVFGVINIVGNFEQCLLVKHFGNVP